MIIRLLDNCLEPSSCGLHVSPKVLLWRGVEHRFA